jgi:hypothetical protein
MADMHEIETAVREDDTGTPCSQGLKQLNQLFFGHNLVRHGAPSYLSRQPMGSRAIGRMDFPQDSLSS